MHFCIFPMLKAHTFLASGQSHNTCSTVSIHSQHSPHVASTCTLRLCRFPLVGKIFEHARHRNVRTFGGTFSFQIFFHIGRSILALECSVCALSFNLSATWYADLTVNFLLPFSFQIKLSLLFYFRTC